MSMQSITTAAPQLDGLSGARALRKRRHRNDRSLPC